MSSTDDNATGAEPIQVDDAETGYAVVAASSHDEAVRIMSEHRHLRLFPGNSVDVLECPPLVV